MAKNENLFLSVVIPCRNEARNISRTIRNIIKILEKNNISFEIVIVDDYSSDKIKPKIDVWREKEARVRYIKNDYPAGFGFAIRKGLDSYKGDAVAIVMADGSDDPADIIRYYTKLCEGYDCVFGTRFSKKSKIIGYPFHKLIINRVGNWFMKILFWIPYNDVSNAFKCYRREAINGISPLFSCHFNLTVEMPLKAITRGFSWCVIPTNWFGRKKGISKWKIKELGSRYLFIVGYVWLERILSRGDYKKGKYWVRKEK